MRCCLRCCFCSLVFVCRCTRLVTSCSNPSHSVTAVFAFAPLRHSFSSCPPSSHLLSHFLTPAQSQAYLSHRHTFFFSFSVTSPLFLFLAFVVLQIDCWLRVSVGVCAVCRLPLTLTPVRAPGRHRGWTHPPFCSVPLRLRLWFAVEVRTHAKKESTEVERTKEGKKKPSNAEMPRSRPHLALHLCTVVGCARHELVVKVKETPK